jgi:hypothetical protein
MIGGKTGMTGSVDIIHRRARRDRIGGDALIVLGRCKVERDHDQPHGLTMGVL